MFTNEHDSEQPNSAAPGISARLESRDLRVLGGNPVGINQQVCEFVRASKAENTIRGYTSDWREFCEWCQNHCMAPLPAAAETVASYIADCAGHLKPGSIQRRLNAIAEAHKAMALESPTHTAVVANTMKGIRRTLGTAPAQKTAA